jgi:two-component system LytT family response regulator
VPGGRKKTKKNKTDRRADNNNTTEIFDNIIVNSKGEERIIAWHNAVITDKKGKVTGILASGEDVTEKRKQENSRYLLRSFLSNFAGQKPNGKKIVLKTTDDIHIVEVSKIIRCESDGSYTKVHLSGKSQIIVSKNLKEFEELLADFGLLRIHHSHLVNINHIERFHKRSGGLIVMSDGSEIPVSVRRKENLIELFERL